MSTWYYSMINYPKGDPDEITVMHELAKHSKAEKPRTWRGMSEPAYSFRAAAREDLPMLRRWLQSSEIVRWWGLSLPKAIGRTAQQGRSTGCSHRSRPRQSQRTEILWGGVLRRQRC